MQRIHPWLFGALTLGATACGAVSGEPLAGHDAGVTHPIGKPDAVAVDTGRPSVDAGTPDVHVVPKDAGHDSTPGDAAVPPIGTLLNASDAHVILGITDDDYVIYEGANAIYALSVVPGSKPILIAGSNDPDAGADAGGLGQATAFAYHDLVFVWSGLTQNYVGALSVWSSTIGTPRSLSPASLYGAVAVSSDSKYFVYTGGANETGSIATLYGSAAAAGASSATLAASIEATMACGFEPAFSGSYALVQYCPVNDAGAASPPAIYAFEAGTWAQTTILSNTTSFDPDSTGTDTVVLTAAGVLELATVSGAATDVPLDPTIVPTQSQSYFLSTTDHFALYTTGTGALEVSTLPLTSPLKLQTANVNGIIGLSPDEKWAIVNNANDPTTMYPTDLSLVSTSAAGPATLLTTGSIADTSGGKGTTSGFTQDGSHLVFLSDIKFNSSYALTGASLSAAPIGTAGKVTPITTNVAYYWSMSTAANVIYNDDYVYNAGTYGRATLHSIDLAGTASPTLLQANADSYFVLTSDGTKLIYSIDTSATTNGLYVVEL